MNLNQMLVFEHLSVQILKSTIEDNRVFSSQSLLNQYLQNYNHQKNNQLL